jgi:hypothetical protein
MYYIYTIIGEMIGAKMEEKSKIEEKLVSLKTFKKFAGSSRQLISDAKENNKVDLFLQAQPYLTELGLMNPTQFKPKKSVWSLAKQITNTVNNLSDGNKNYRKVFAMHQLANILHEAYPNDFSREDKNAFQQYLFRATSYVSDSEFSKEIGDMKKNAKKEYEDTVGQQIDKSKDIAKDKAKEQAFEHSNLIAKSALGLVPGVVGFIYSQATYESLTAIYEGYRLKKEISNPYTFDERGFGYYKDILVYYSQSKERLQFIENELQLAKKELKSTSHQDSSFEATNLEKNIEIQMLQNQIERLKKKRQDELGLQQSILEKVVDKNRFGVAEMIAFSRANSKLKEGMMSLSSELSQKADQLTTASKQKIQNVSDYIRKRSSEFVDSAKDIAYGVLKSNDLQLASNNIEHLDRFNNTIEEMDSLLKGGFINKKELLLADQLLTLSVEHYKASIELLSKIQSAKDMKKYGDTFEALNKQIKLLEDNMKVLDETFKDAQNHRVSKISDIESYIMKRSGQEPGFISALSKKRKDIGQKFKGTPAEQKLHAAKKVSDFADSKDVILAIDTNAKKALKKGDLHTAVKGYIPFTDKGEVSDNDMLNRKKALNSIEKNLTLLASSTPTLTQTQISDEKEEAEEAFEQIPFGQGPMSEAEKRLFEQFDFGEEMNDPDISDSIKFKKDQG